MQSRVNAEVGRVHTAPSPWSHYCTVSEVGGVQLRGFGSDQPCEEFVKLSGAPQCLLRAQASAKGWLLIWGTGVETIKTCTH